MTNRPHERENVGFPQCPYCLSEFNLYSWDTTKCVDCKKFYRNLWSITTYATAKSCELNREQHEFKPIPDDYPYLSCVKCGEIKLSPTEMNTTEGNQ